MSGVFSRRGAQPPPPPPKPAAPPEADPSMEDILASIRRILNEGEGEAAPAEAAAAPEAAEPVAAPPAPVAEAPAQASVANPAPVTESGSVTPEKETQSASTTGNEPVEGEDVFILDTAMMVADTAVAEAPAEAPIASTETMAAASQSVGALKKALSERQAQVYKQHAVSLEEIVREEVRPMLKGWLDTHLPAIVERLVRAEIERVVAREML